jgi:hypothetical protein
MGIINNNIKTELHETGFQGTEGMKLASDTIHRCRLVGKKITFRRHKQVKVYKTVKGVLIYQRKS